MLRLAPALPCLMALVALGCGDDSRPSTGCTPEDVRACTCTDGRSGTQTCGPDTTWDYCMCEGVLLDAGDAGGSIDGGSQDAGTPIEWPASPDEYVVEQVAYVNTMTVPPVVRETVDCCRDFGMISRDYIEAGTSEIDNAVAEVADSLTSLGYDLQMVLNGLLADGTFVLLLDHRDLDGATDPDFVLVALNGEPDGMGGYLVRRDAFVPGTGRPRSVFVPASVSAGSVEAGPGDAYIPVPFGPAVTIYKFEGTHMAGSIDLSSGVRYSAGTMAGWLTIDEYFRGINEIMATQCGCLGISGPLYEKTGTTWTHHCANEAAAMASCTATGEGVCVQMGSGLACTVQPLVIPESADIDLNPAMNGYEALSFGLRFTAIPATVSGLTP